jgi:hypothetical protein
MGKVGGQMRVSSVVPSAFSSQVAVISEFCHGLTAQASKPVKQHGSLDPVAVAFIRQNIL